MYGNRPDGALVVWGIPQCPFTIEYSAQMMDDIRLAVVDAFFSLPRGGAEIGGILLGRREPGRLLLLDYAPLDCEHATGPSFTLSARDEEKLRDLLANVRSDIPGVQPVGWYHSHTRSEIFLSPADLEIHNRYFPHPWQVALVLKPHTFQPTRAGFFFREASGGVQAAKSYQEIEIQALPMRPVPVGDAASGTAVAAGPTVRTDRNASLPTMAEKLPEPKPEPEAPDSKPDVAPPQFLTAQTPPPSRWRAVLGICGLAAVAAGGYASRDLWIGRVSAAVHAKAPTPLPPALGLNAIDREGQLQIVWDRNSPAVEKTADAVLEITDGGAPPQTVALDRAHLQNGVFTYARQTERVDMKLVLHIPGGQSMWEVTTFLGKPPHTEDPEVRKERDQLAEEAAKLKSDLNTQAARTRKLERDLKNIQDEIRTQQQRRMANQIPDAKP